MSFELPITSLPDQDFGATFSECRKYRYCLWRIWDRSKPMVMFVGLNPSKADEVEPDPTIKSVGRISKFNGYGGFFMMNCFAYVSTDPDQLIILGQSENGEWLKSVGSICADVVFAWGAFDIVKATGRDWQLAELFPNAKALFINKSGSPKHPLYCKSETKLINWKKH